jgi:hypothetical protein
MCRRRSRSRQVRPSEASPAWQKRPEPTTTKNHSTVPERFRPIVPYLAHMGYPLRWFKGGRLYETTSRTIHSRLLLLPSEELNNIVRGIIARGVRKYGVEVSYFITNVDTPPRPHLGPKGRQISRFMNFINSKHRQGGGPVVRMAREVLGPPEVVDDLSTMARRQGERPTYSSHLRPLPPDLFPRCDLLPPGRLLRDRHSSPRR